MSLSLYKKKRKFEVTPEPTGGKPKEQRLRFVIQKHDASHLHYDFRLEMEGVLKSWAVPKGPSTDPDIKRLAMMVEDHPFDYRNFEGIIPKGQYGGGTVIVWDEGFYEPAEGEWGDKRSMEKNLLSQLHKGKIVFKMDGKKMKGEYALVKSSYQGENSWLLMKLKDKYASKTDITLKDKSAVSGKTIAQMEKKPSSVYGQSSKKKAETLTKKAGPIPKRSASSKIVASALSKTTAKKPGNGKTAAISKTTGKKKVLPAGVKAKFPSQLSPMLATLVDQPFDDPDWIYEVKWDGYRAVGSIHKGEVNLRSRNNKSFNEKFYPVTGALKTLGFDAILDGEVIVSNEDGVSNFGHLQNWRSEADGTLVYYVFDLLWYDGYSLLDLPLTERREKLKEILPENPLIQLSQAFESTGTEFYEAARKMGLEGIMAKKKDSLYSPGIRTKEWLKIKIAQRQEVVIGGFTRNEDSPKLFSSLLVGVFENGKLQYTGKIGTGFSDKLQQEMIKQFKPLIQEKNPFTIEPDVNKPSRFRPYPPKAAATWLKPKLVCEVSFTEMTSDGVMRHPSFEGMRIDKNASEVARETAEPAKKIVKETILHKEKLIRMRKTKERKTLLNPTDEQQEREINGHLLKFGHLSKIYWPKEKYTKRDLLNYYYQVAPFILPYLVDRPQSLNRHPDGISGQSFYQKDVSGKAPTWIPTFPYTTEGKKKKFMVVKEEAELLYMASLGCIEMNPWSSRIDSPDNPDWSIIDLDPDKNSFDQVIETALMTKQVLDLAGIQGYCKTSGSTGIHIYIPLGAKYDYEASKEFARVIATMVHRELPKFTSIERATAARKGKIYIDFLQNRPQATLAAAYSVRPKPGATVSMPLHWEELKKGLRITDFTILNALDRIKEQGDIFKPVMGKGINLEKVVKTLQKL